MQSNSQEHYGMDQCNEGPLAICQNPEVVHSEMIKFLLSCVKRT